MGDKTTVKMEKKLVKRAHELGLNVSKTCENALKVAVEALEGTSVSGKKKGTPTTNQLNNDGAGE